MLGGLFNAPVVHAVRQALATGSAGPRLLVVGDAALATALATDHEVSAAAIPARAARRLPRVIAGSSSALEAAATSFDAVIGLGAAGGDGGARLTEWTRLVRDGGLVVMVDRADETAATRRALCAGLADIEQRPAGRHVVTSGYVTR